MRLVRLNWQLSEFHKQISIASVLWTIKFEFSFIVGVFRLLYILFHILLASVIITSSSDVSANILHFDTKDYHCQALIANSRRIHIRLQFTTVWRCCQFLAMHVLFIPDAAYLLFIIFRKKSLFANFAYRYAIRNYTHTNINDRTCNIWWFISWTCLSLSCQKANNNNNKHHTFFFGYICVTILGYFNSSVDPEYAELLSFWADWIIRRFFYI